jgi:hypothetical protein
MNIFFDLDFDSPLSRRRIARALADIGRNYGYAHWQLVDEKDPIALARAILAAPRSLRRFGAPISVQFLGVVLYYLFVPLLLTGWLVIDLFGRIFFRRQESPAADDPAAEKGPQFCVRTETPLPLGQARSLIRELVAIPHSRLTLHIYDANEAGCEDASAEGVGEPEAYSMSQGDLQTMTEERLAELVGSHLKIA